MIITVFRNRLNPDNIEQYYDWAGRMSELAKTMPGYISHKSFEAADTERVTIVEFEDLASTRAWGSHPEHQKAMALGKQKFYLEYSIQVCQCL
ncbi:MAG: antibiotic biosynthesis monooxygenase [Gammaproteobacteria bacterium]|nr:antibiotic biosynthesis monooxygenase [Gammaproteobacteria bacterium]